MAERLGLSVETIREVYTEHDGEFQIVAHSSKLEPSKLAAAQQIAVLVCVARQGSGMEEWTDPSHIRESAKDLDRFDQGNFSKAIKKTKGLQKRKDGHLKLSKPGWEAAIVLVEGMAEPE